LINFGSFECIINVWGPNYLGCIVFQPQMAEGDYLVMVKSQEKYDTITYVFVRSPPFISAVDPPSKRGGQAVFWGDFGLDNTLPVYLLVGEENCVNIQFNQARLSCNLGPGEGLKQITVSLNGTIWKSSPTGFNYLEDEKQCLNECNSHGKCSYGSCYCFEGYGGTDCSNIIDAGVVERNENSVTISKEDYKFGFSIVNITESDFNGDVKRSIPLSNWKIKDDQGNKWTYYTIFDKATISYTIEMVNTTKSFNFAGVDMILTPGTVKLTANISNWQYLGSLNSLQMHIQSRVYSQAIESKCGNNGSLITSDLHASDQSSSLNYISIEIGNKIFYGRFIDKVLSDGKPTFSRVSVTEQSNSSITVSINLPYCKECIIDPDFSVLVSIKGVDECGNELPTSKKWIIPVAVVVSLVGFACLCTLAIVLLRKRVYLSFSMKKGIVIVKKRKTTRSRSSSEGSRMR